MHQPSSPKCGSETPETEKVPVLLVKRIREAILDEVFHPADRLVEVDLAEKFELSQQSVHEALLALKKEGALIRQLQRLLAARLIDWMAALPKRGQGANRHGA